MASKQWGTVFGLYGLETLADVTEVQQAIARIHEDEVEFWALAHARLAPVVLNLGLGFKSADSLLHEIIVKTNEKDPAVVWRHRADKAVERLKAGQGFRDTTGKPSSHAPSPEELRNYYLRNSQTLKFRYASTGNKQSEPGLPFESVKGVFTYYGMLDSVQDRSYALLDIHSKTFTGPDGVELPDKCAVSGMYVAFNLLDVVDDFPVFPKD